MTFTAGPTPQGDATRERILEAIDHFQFTNGWPPTIREIGERVGLKSVSSVQRNLTILEAEKKIRRGSGPRMVAVL